MSYTSSKQSSISCGKYSVHTKTFNSVDVTSMRGLGSGHSNPVDVILAPLAGASVAAPPPPHAVRMILARTHNASTLMMFDLLISSSFRRLGVFWHRGS